MTFQSDIDKVIDLIQEPIQTIRLDQTALSLSLLCPRLRLAPGGEPLIVDCFNAISTYSTEHSKIVINRYDQRAYLKRTVLSKISRDIVDFLALKGKSKRTSISQFFNYRDLNRSNELGESLYQIWKYMKKQPKDVSVRDTNVIGLLDVVMNKYNGKI